MFFQRCIEIAQALFFFKKQRKKDKQIYENQGGLDLISATFSTKNNLFINVNKKKYFHNF